MGDDVMDLLKAHDYFRGIGDNLLGQIASTGRVTNYDAGAVVHQLDEPFASTCFVLRGRVQAVRVDARGLEHLFQVFERGDQYGIMLGGLGESLPVRLFALEPSTILSLDHEASMELMFQHVALRRQWLQTYARSLRRKHFEPAAPRPPRLLAILHPSPATRAFAQQLVGRLLGLGEVVGVISDEGSWQKLPNVRFRSLTEGGRFLEVVDIRQQVAEWDQADRIVVDVAAVPGLDWAAILRPADGALVFVRAGEIEPAVERVRALDVKSQGWRDKIALVWLLEAGHTVPPDVPETQVFASRQFNICESPLAHPWGKMLSGGMERLVHHLRGIRIGVALGGGAARGMAHLGVLKTLDENGIVVDAIAGTSAGAMTGVLYAAGLDCQYLANQFAADLRLPWVFRQLPSGGYWYLLYKYRRGHFDPMLRQYLRDWKLEQLAVPCLTVTIDLVSGQTLVRERGDAVHAVLESINLPMLSAPICRNGQALIDGGFANNIPADVLTAHGCNLVIAVSVTAQIARQFGDNKPETPTRRMRTPSALRTLFRTLEVQNYSLNAIGVRPAEVVIEPDVIGFDLSEFMRARELAAAGERATLGPVARIKQLLARLDPALFRPGP